MSIILKPAHPDNHGPLRVRPPELLILHGTGIAEGAKADAEVAWLTRPMPPGQRVGYHFYVSKDGRIFELVNPDFIAYHAGESIWNPEAARIRDVPWPAQETKVWEGLNSSSIGIGLESGNREDEKYPAVQLYACKWLAQGLIGRYGIPPYRVLSHKMVSGPRKSDPKNFNMLAFTAQLEYRHVVLFKDGEPISGAVVSGDAASLKP